MKMAHEPKTNEDDAVRFLEWKMSGGPWPITAIEPDGRGTPTRWLADADAVRAFVAKHSGRANLHYTVAEIRPGVERKPKKTDLLETTFLHADLDPPKGLHPAEIDEWIEAEVARVRALNTVPPPSLIACSGNRLHLLWRLDAPLFIGGTEERWIEVESRNRWIVRELSGDGSTWNCDRLLKLYGSINVPDATKRKAGRVPRETRIIDMNDGVHSLCDFGALEAGATRATSGPAAVPALRGGVRRLTHPDQLAEWGISETDRLRVLIVQGCDPNNFDGDRSDGVFDLCCNLHRRDVPPGLIAGIISDPTWPVSAHVIDKGGRDVIGYAWRQVEQAVKTVAADGESGGRRVLDPAAPFATATRLRAELFPNTIHTNDDWLEYDRGAYRAVEDATMRSAVWEALDAAAVRTVTQGVVKFQPFKPGSGQVSAVLDALKGVAHQPADRMAPPVWLDGDGPPPEEIISCGNGLLHVPTGELLPPTPRFLTRNALDLDFDPSAPAPAAWLEFVDEVFPDADAAALLQEWFGYFLLPDTSQEKMLLLVGPPRSGKGTIQKVLTELVGRSNACAPSIKSLGGGFGLQPMIGKQVAFLSDIRIGSGSDRAAITETLLRITGRDDVTADRKHKEAWTGRLAVRFFVATNEMPSLTDNSPALANRFVPLILERSFLGKEDPRLAERLVAELPGILNWSLAGWRRLRERGHFVLPDASTEAIGEILELGSPVAAFIRDMCEVAPGRRVKKEQLYAAWQRWCEANKLVPGRIEHFARSLRAATSHRVESARPSINGQRTYVFEGIALCDHDVPY